MSKKNKALGIGNAIVDAICKIDENFLKSHNLQKGTMKLIDDYELKKLKKKIKPSGFIAGGSVANSMVGLSSFGNTVYFFGKVNNDLFGKKYFESLKKENVGFNFQQETHKDSTGICFVFITPDGERTLNTYLGIANKLSEKDNLLEMYQYSNKNLLKTPEKYEMTPYHGFSFLLSFVKSREYFLKLDVEDLNDNKLFDLLSQKSLISKYDQKNKSTYNLFSKILKQFLDKNFDSQQIFLVNIFLHNYF